MTIIVLILICWLIYVVFSRRVARSTKLMEVLPFVSVLFGILSLVQMCFGKVLSDNGVTTFLKHISLCKHNAFFLSTTGNNSGFMWEVNTTLWLNLLAGILGLIVGLFALKSRRKIIAVLGITISLIGAISLVYFYIRNNPWEFMFI